MVGIKRLARTSAWCVAATALALMVSACGTVRQTSGPALSRGDKVAVVSIANYTETPDAGKSAESIAANALRVGGIADVRIAPADANRNAMFDTNQRADGDKALEWARSQSARYVLSGAVEEWRYKTGVDGEPVVGVTFELIDVSNGAVVWSATGTRTGWSRSGLSSVATSLIAKVLSPLQARQ
ncbi:penicillin-binding protein activator LpoB [Paraburkholderia dipogonis]|jgi:TolB-like protein|uniref:penicillin-binding protein activator LpoB n=1 Tax=Paraburkholderia dipogonis TaxID=1211383 RepID=UPI0038BB0301